MHQLSRAANNFILHWGEMGTRWGVNRTVAQIHALLYLSPRPMNAEEIATTLSVARSNVSTSLRELQGWNIVRLVHVMGDRRDYYESLADVWEMFQIILEERKRREIDPTIALLQKCVEQAQHDDAHTRRRLGEVAEFFGDLDTWYRSVTTLPRPAIKRFIKLGSKVRKLLGV